MLDADSIRNLRALQPEFSLTGIAALYVFGSYARNEARPESDVDIAFDVMPNARFSLLDQGRSQVRLNEVLGRRVDLVERAALNPLVRERIEREMIRVF